VVTFNELLYHNRHHCRPDSPRHDQPPKHRCSCPDLPGSRSSSPQCIIGDPVPNQAPYPECICGSRVLLHFLCPHRSSFLVPREAGRSIITEKHYDDHSFFGKLNGLQRCASWVRRLRVREWEPPEDITRLFVPASSNPHPFLLLTLRKLDWGAQ